MSQFACVPAALMPGVPVRCLCQALTPVSDPDYLHRQYVHDGKIEHLLIHRLLLFS